VESLTRLVSESFARHGFDRPLDYRRLHWSRWFRCESHHSLLSVPSKPGVFALAEDIADFAPGRTRVGTGASPVQAGQSSAAHSYPANDSPNEQEAGTTMGERRFSAASSAAEGAAVAAGESSRLLAVVQFFDADDMAFILDRMLTRSHPLHSRLASGRYFIRYVIVENESQRRSIATALNQWIVNQSVANAAETSGIGAHFASSLEITETRVGAGEMPPHVEATTARVGADAFVRPAREASMKDEGSVLILPHAIASKASPHLDSGAAANIHCPSPFPSGF
jgi:hypothetical protein